MTAAYSQPLAARDLLADLHHNGAPLTTARLAASPISIAGKVRDVAADGENRTRAVRLFDHHGAYTTGVRVYFEGDAKIEPGDVAAFSGATFKEINAAGDVVLTGARVFKVEKDASN